MSVKVKICGLKRPEDIRAVNEFGADYAGFVFFKKSRRNLSFEEAGALLSLLDDDIRAVAVCVSPAPEFLERVQALGFDRIQIHGEVSPEVLEGVKVPVWQALNIAKAKDLERIIRHKNIDGYVIDGAEYGSGKTFGWENESGVGLPAGDGREKDGISRVGGDTASAIRMALRGRKFILAGGLNPENVRAGIRLLNPDVVDVSSGVETDHAKDRHLIRRFTERVRAER